MSATSRGAGSCRGSVAYNRVTGGHDGLTHSGSGGLTAYKELGTAAGNELNSHRLYALKG